MTFTQRQRFLRELAVTGNHSFAAGAAACTVRQCFEDRNADPKFERAWRAAEEEARRAFLQRIR